jgi:hypothetical protein
VVSLWAKNLKLCQHLQKNGGQGQVGKNPKASVKPSAEYWTQRRILIELFEGKRNKNTGMVPAKI